MRALVLALACMTGACASTYAANPNDPVDMAAQLGDRGRQYVGMGEVCDIATSGGRHQAIIEALRHQQQRLGSLSDLVDRAYRGTATEELSTHMQAQMRTHGLSAPEFCDAVVQQARAEFSRRTAVILGLESQFDGMVLVREADRADYYDTPHFDPEIGYTSWLD